MAGIYFIAAGASSKNREKSLDRALDRRSMQDLLPLSEADRLAASFHAGPCVYAWGANRVGDLGKLDDGDFVVDVKNKKVVRVFQFAFFFETATTRLQEWIGWDAEKPSEGRRPYQLVYFLRDPKPTMRYEKDFFAEAFRVANNQNWLVGQRWFSDTEVKAALERTNSPTVEAFLGITGRAIRPPRDPMRRQLTPAPETDPPSGHKERKQSHEDRSDEIRVSAPWLEPVIQQVWRLKEQSKTLEREHEDAVAHFFEVLGYQRGSQIKFQRGLVDILIELEDQAGIGPLVVEVKRDWALSKESRKHIHQAYRYALEQGARFVIVTNSDRFLIYDRTKGLDLTDQFVGDFQLTHVTQPGLALIERFRYRNIEREFGDDTHNYTAKVAAPKSDNSKSMQQPFFSRLKSWFFALLK